MAIYDVVVVGAGNTGLAAALKLARAGTKVLLIEQKHVPGGCATSYKRGRFEFDPSLHEICDVGSDTNPGDTRKFFDSMGVKINWIRINDCFRVISNYSDGGYMDVTMPAGKENFIDACESYVPDSREKVVRFFELLDEVMAGVAYVNQSRGNPDPNVLRTTYANYLRTGAYPVNKVFQAMGLPRRICDILSTYWPYLGVDLDRMPFVHYAVMIGKYIELGPYIPLKTSHEISSAMEDAIREYGGEIWFNCRANEFVFKDGKISGIKTNMGLIETGHVLANINPEIVYGKMMDRSQVPERQLKLISARKGHLAGRMFTVIAGLDCPYKELGIHDYCIFLPGTVDSVTEYRNMQHWETNNMCIFICYNIANRDFSPEGTCVVSFTTLCGPEDFNDVTPEEYEKRKNSMAAKLIDNFYKKTGIDISDHIEEIDISSPVTLARYLGTPEGCAYGYECAEWDGMMARMMMMRQDIPSTGLVPMGAAGPKGGGYGVTYTIGDTMAGVTLGLLAEEKTKRGGGPYGT